MDECPSALFGSCKGRGLIDLSLRVNRSPEKDCCGNLYLQRKGANIKGFLAAQVHPSGATEYYHLKGRDKVKPLLLLTNNLIFLSRILPLKEVLFK